MQSLSEIATSAKNMLYAVPVAFLPLVGTGCNSMIDPLARAMVDMPDAPIAPVQPEKQVATRGPVQLMVGVDTTKSAIRKQLPSVLTVTGETLNTPNMLVEGDAVTLCQIGGKGAGATCETYTLEDDRNDLEKDLGGIQSTQMDTWIGPAFQTMGKQVKKGATTVVAAWTDGKEENPQFLAGGQTVNFPSPTHLMVPDAAYSPDAQRVCDKTLTGGKCEVDVVTTAEQFRTTLNGYLVELKGNAQASADAKADADFREATREYDLAQIEYGEAKTAYDADVANKQEALKHARNKAAALLFAAGLAVVGALGGLAAYVTRPRLNKGLLLDVRGRSARRIPLKREENNLSLAELGVDSSLTEIRLKATRTQGLFTNQKGEKNTADPLTSGAEIAPGIYYFSSQPKTEIEQRLLKEYKAQQGGDQGTETLRSSPGNLDLTDLDI